MHRHTQLTAFEGSRRIASGELAEIVWRTKETLDRGGHEPVLIFDDATGEQVDIPYMETADEFPQSRVRTEPDDEVAEAVSVPNLDVPRGPGRPRLGVIARGDLVAPALGMVEQSARRRVRCNP